MKNIWKTVAIIVLTVMILGAVCVGIGLATGADAARIYQVVDKEYSVSSVIRDYEAQVKLITGNIRSAING